MRLSRISGDWLESVTVSGVFVVKIAVLVFSSSLMLLIVRNIYHEMKVLDIGESENRSK